MLDTRVAEARLDFATLRFEVEISNPCETELSVKGLRYGLTSGSNTFLSAGPVSGTAIGPNDTTTVLLSHEVVYERLLRALGARPGATIPFTLELRLWLEAAGWAVAQVPLRSEGRLFLPEAGPSADRPLDVIYIATPQDVVERMLSMAQVKKDDLLYDLGCGDGRIAVTAAGQYGCRAVGYDIDPCRVEESRENVRKNDLAPLVTIEQRDIFTVDLEPADVVALYLNPVVNRRLVPQLEKLKGGSRIVSHSFPMGELAPDQVVTMTSSEDGQEHRIYLYTAPVKESPAGRSADPAVK
jgi:SAM-dependent methyltransferase